MCYCEELSQCCVPFDRQVRGILVDYYIDIHDEPVAQCLLYNVGQKWRIADRSVIFKNLVIKT